MLNAVGCSGGVVAGVVVGVGVGDDGGGWLGPRGRERDAREAGPALAAPYPFSREARKSIAEKFIRFTHEWISPPPR
jgi:hypothetical protein